MSRSPNWKDFFTGARGLLLLGAIALVVIGSCLRYVVKAPPHRLVIATDGPDGSFTRIARLYGDRLANEGVALEIVNTHGSVENLALLNSPSSTVDVAFVNGGLTDSRRSPNLESLGSIAYDPIWVVYRSALGDLDGIPKLRGRTIGLGPQGSGTESIARTLLGVSGVTESNSVLRATTGDPEATSTAILDGALDAAFIIKPPEDASLRPLFSREGLSVMNLLDAAGLARNLAFLHALVVPRSTLDLVHQKPDRDLSIVASTITLVARKSVHPALIYLLMSIVDEVHEPPSLLHRENEFPSDKDTDLPLSPQAESYYRSGKPFLQRYLPFGLASAVERFTKVVVPVGLVAFPFLRVFPVFFQWRVKRKLAGIYRQLLDVERAVYAADGSVSPEEWDRRLTAIDTRLHAENIPIMYSNELYVLREHIELARRQIASAIKAPERPAAATVDA